jgi:hypothetical protein
MSIPYCPRTRFARLHLFFSAGIGTQPARARAPKVTYTARVRAYTWYADAGTVIKLPVNVLAAAIPSGVDHPVRILQIKSVVTTSTGWGYPVDDFPIYFFSD